jgi:hypothetical protein
MPIHQQMKMPLETMGTNYDDEFVHRHRQQWMDCDGG